MSTVVVLLSDKRSGSTMLQEALCSHSAIQHVAYSPHTYFETHHWLKGAVVLDRPAALYSGGRAYGGYGSRENARTYLRDTLATNLPGEALPAADEELVFGGWEALCRRFARPVFFEKSPQILAHWAALDLFLRWARTTRFTVRVVGLVRNPLAVQYSAEQLFATDAAARQFGWLEAQRNMLALAALLPAGVFRMWKYEDIVDAPDVRLAEIAAHVGVEAEPQMGQHVHGHSREKWREDPSYALRLDRAVVELATALGYQESELQNPHRASAAAPAARRNGRALRRQLNRLRDRILRPIYLRLKTRSRASDA